MGDRIRHEVARATRSKYHSDSDLSDSKGGQEEDSTDSDEYETAYGVHTVQESFEEGSEVSYKMIEEEKGKKNQKKLR